ncbi:MAG: prephenate dehydrogenase/arogenate dehydrogenase family protein [Planctomycetales bacterium]|nr:prephenate dehydrogenase/arogenate dehydrogenase family protein [Planctomycetales bacterium]
MSASWEHIAILGVGLIGGSIGQAVRHRSLAKRVVGLGRSPRQLEIARSLGAIDEGTTDLSHAVTGADLVIIATPVNRIIEQVRAVQQMVEPGALITDAGSTKSDIVRGCGEDRTDRATFIGGHPLAGGERSGVDAASPDLFEKRLVVLTPTPTTPANALARLTSFWRELGANPVEMSAEEHDRILAQTSHVPHCVASALAAATPAELLDFAATGWRDTTRVAAGDVGLWTEILKQNSVPIAEGLDAVRTQLQDMIEALRQCDWDRVTRLLQEGKQRRDALGS